MISKSVEPEQPLRYFVRDDDIGELSAGLQFFVETFIERAIPVSYQIIPSRLTSDCAAYLLAQQQAHPGLLEFGQHGLHHGMMLGRRELLREFGPERSPAQQASDISEGLRLLHEQLGLGTHIEVFTPPQHKYDRHTIKAAAAVGHRVFSAAYYPSRRHQIAYALGRRLGVSSLRHHGISYHGARRPEADIVEISISVDVDDGKVIRFPAEALPAIVEKSARRSTEIGFMFHHDVYSGAERRAELVRLADGLSTYGAENFFLLSALAKLDGASPGPDRRGAPNDMRGGE